MTQFIPFLIFLLAPFAAALPPNRQQPFTASTAPSETQPYPLGLYDHAAQWPNQLACTTGHVRAFSSQSTGRYVSALLTFKYPDTKYKYCWLEFNAPAPLKSDGNPFKVIVRPFTPALSCPPPSFVTRGDIFGSIKFPAKGGNGTWEGQIGDVLNRPMKSRCPETTGTLQGVEIVPMQGIDFDLVWSQKWKGEGVRLMYSN